ncbi:MAG: formylglycine-generating enzyme family protein, partial [Methylococcaceae bacterium]|nr:formylglycine-generating enzyme family protein [Methylococcaceae bacterium]
DESCRPHPIADAVGDRTLNFIALCPGSFMMGAEDGTRGQSPRHYVRIAAFAIGRDEVTFDEYDAFARATHRDSPGDGGWGRGRRPVINVSWDDAQAYAQWLSRQTGKRYRLPTEAEWEYAARAGTRTEYWWGNDIRQDGKAWANCDGCGSERDNRQTAPVGSFPPNAFGLDDTAGNVWEWVQDCYHDDYRGAPGDGRAWESGTDCGRRVIRGGSWYHVPVLLRSASRDWSYPFSRTIHLGFRLAQDL